MATLATGRAVWGSNLGECEIFRARPDGPGAHPVCYIIGTGWFLGVNRPECAVKHPHSSGAEVKEKYRYTSPPPLCLHGRLWGACCLYLYGLTPRGTEPDTWQKHVRLCYAQNGTDRDFFPFFSFTPILLRPLYSTYYFTHIPHHVSK
jgi:hypothetical protein